MAPNPPQCMWVWVFPCAVMSQASTNCPDSCPVITCRNQKLIIIKQLLIFLLIPKQLLYPLGNLLIRGKQRAFAFDHNERQAIYKNDDIRNIRPSGKLIDDKKFIVVYTVIVDELYSLVFTTLSHVLLHRKHIDEQLMKRLITLLRARHVHMCQGPELFVQVIFR